MGQCVPSQNPKMRPPTHLGIGLLLAFSSLSIDAKGATDITAVAARASDAYVRTKGPDGAFPVEYYAFGNGGHYGGQMADDQHASQGHQAEGKRANGTNGRRCTHE